MKRKSVFIILALLVFAANASAQNGGKAEPNRIAFAKGKSTATVSGKIKGDEQAEHVFSARKGQKISARITSVPKGKFASFAISKAFGEREGMSEYDVNFALDFTADATGDYLIYVNFRPAGKVMAARYSLTLTVK